MSATHSSAVRVLIADDSKTMRAILAVILSSDPGITIVGEAADGIEAVECAKALKPDVITMDIQMPRMSGLDAIDAIMEQAPSRILVICSVGDQQQVDLSFRAIAAGALELIAKPTGAAAIDNPTWRRQVIEAVRLMAEIPVVRRRRAFSRPDQPPIGGGRVDAFGVVASTGGPPALASLLGAMPRDLPIPLLVAQHMAPGFGAGLFRWLCAVTRLKVEVAVDGAACRPGRVYLPPDGKDIAVDREGLLRVPLSTSLHCPSGNVLLTSLVAAYGARAGGIVLTGMGDDGATGLSLIRAAGGVALAQDEASCVVFGMPKAALAVGAVAVPFIQIPSTICDLCAHPSIKPPP